jgi:hypothetical protein
VADAATEDLDDEFDHIDESHYVDTEDSTKHKKKSPIFRRCGELAVPLTLPLTYDSDPSPSPSSSPDRFPFGRRYDVGFFSLPLIWRPPPQSTIPAADPHRPVLAGLWKKNPPKATTTTEVRLTRPGPCNSDKRVGALLRAGENHVETWSHAA